MRLLQSVLIALEMLRRHKLRAFLTMLGVIIGVMSVTMIVMLSNGFQSYLNTQFAKLGADTIFVFYDPFQKMRGQSNGGIDHLSLDDMKMLRERVTAIDMVSADMNVPTQNVVFGTNTVGDPQIHGVDANFQVLNRFKILAGRTLTQSDVDQAANVCLIGEDVRDRLFPQEGSLAPTDPSAKTAPPPDADSPAGKALAAQGNRAALGQVLLFQGIALRVVGIIERQSFLGDSTGRMILVPISTAQKKWTGGDKLDTILLRARPGVNVDTAMEAVWEALMVRSGGRSLYRVDSNQSILKVFGNLVGTAGTVLAGIAALSLLVGGIGIMNIMLVSVTERTKEIGLRKAIGARRLAILTQFLIEAGTLSLVGGVIGMFIAWSIGLAVTAYTASIKWPTPEGLATPFPLVAAIAAAAFSAFVGMVFGFYPAMSASQLDPIVALRTE